MNKKIIVLIGISNSGKSTFAATTVQNNPDLYVAINRDKIRELLYGYTEQSICEYYNRPDFNVREKQVTKYEDTLIHEALNEGKTVIVDATHLDKKYIDRYKFWNVPIQIMWFDVLLKEALTRNKSRNRKVDEGVIVKQYNRYVKLRNNFEWEYQPISLKIDGNKPPCYVFDIDGTLAHMRTRGAFDWKKVGEDDLCEAVSPVSIALFQSDYEVIIVSGRDSVCRFETEKWLAEMGIEYDELYMRDENDYRPDWQVKQEIWKKILETNNILAIFDDRLQVCRHAKALGLKVFNVEYNNF